MGTLSSEFDRLIQFGRRFPHPAGGASWLDGNGDPDLSRPIYTWITARMAHVYCLAHLLGVAGAGDLADHAVAGLTGPLGQEVRRLVLQRDGGGRAGREGLLCPCLRVLAASSGIVAGRPDADRLLNEALDVGMTGSGIRRRRCSSIGGTGPSPHSTPIAG